LFNKYDQLKAALEELIQGDQVTRGCHLTGTPIKDTSVAAQEKGVSAFSASGKKSPNSQRDPPSGINESENIM